MNSDRPPAGAEIARFESGVAHERSQADEVPPFGEPEQPSASADCSSPRGQWTTAINGQGELHLRCGRGLHGQSRPCPDAADLGESPLTRREK